jgi:hypothetical protein
VEVIEEVGADSAAGVVTDNAANETTSWDVIREQHPTILATGCTAHGGNLLFKDICEHTWAANIIDLAVSMAKFFRNHQWPAAEVRRRTAADNNGTPLAVILHGATRFAGVYYTLKRLHQLRGTFRQIVVSDDFQSRTFENGAAIEAQCNDASFWSNIANLRLFLKPLKCFIKLMDHAAHTTEHLYPGNL